MFANFDIIQNSSISVEIDEGFSHVEFTGSNTPAEIQMQVENGTTAKRKIKSRSGQSDCRSRKIHCVEKYFFAFIPVCGTLL